MSCTIRLSTPPRGMPSRSLSTATTGSSAGAGASVATRNAARRGSAIARSRRTGSGQAALVLDEDGAAQGWCQYGSPGELPGIKHKREYGKDAPPRPDWRITCFYVDKKHRGQGIARAALEGALDQIAQAGGGLVEAIPEVTTGRAAPGRFLFSATVELFEQYGSTRGRQVGKHAWIVSRVVDPV
jgi:ribosomal protein S18 acetylase RimI-like enzyme